MLAAFALKKKVNFYLPQNSFQANTYKIIRLRLNSRLQHLALFWKTAFLAERLR
jgi:hypothetical protein